MPIGLSPEKIEQIRELARSGKSISHIREEVGVNWHTAQKYAESALYTDKGDNIKVAPPSTIKLLVLSAIERMTRAFIEQVDNGQMVKSKDIKDLMDVYAQFDKINRLDLGLPTETFKFEIIPFRDLMTRLGQADPFANTKDAAIEVKKLKELPIE